MKYLIINYKPPTWGAGLGDGVDNAGGGDGVQEGGLLGAWHGEVVIKQ